jgi:hypothetical protein
MAYVQRFEDNDGIEISEMLPGSYDDNDGVILSPVAAAAVSRGVPSLHEYRYNGSYASKYHQDPPGIHAEISCAESEISFGTEFDQVFDTEIGKVPSGKSWDDMKHIMYTRSSNTGNDDPSSSGEYSSIRRSGSSRCGRMRVHSNGEGSFLVPADSDLDQVFEELSEQQATEEKFMAHLSAFRRSNRSGSGLYSTPLCSLKENCSLDDQENDADRSGESEEGSIRSESYYTKYSVYEDKGLLPPRVPPTQQPLTAISKLSNHQFNRRKMFISGSQQSKNDEHLASTRLPFTKNDDDTAVTSVLTQSTYSYPPPVTIAPLDDSEVLLSVSPADILHDIGKLARRNTITQSTPPNTKRMSLDPFDSESPLESSFDPFGRNLRTIKRPSMPRRSLLPEMLESRRYDVGNSHQTKTKARVCSVDIELNRASHYKGEATHTVSPFIDSPSMKGISKLFESIPSSKTDAHTIDGTSTESDIAAAREDILSQEGVPEQSNPRIVDLEDDVSESSGHISSETNTNDVTHETDNTTIATVSEYSNDEDRLCLDLLHACQQPSILEVDAVLLEEFGIWADMDKWDAYPDDFALDQEIMNMKSPSGCFEIQSTFNEKDAAEVDDIMQYREDDVNSQSTEASSLSENTDTTSLSPESSNLGDKISIHDDEIDVQIASSRDESYGGVSATSATNSSSSPEIASPNGFSNIVTASSNASFSSQGTGVQHPSVAFTGSDSSELSFAIDSSGEYDEVLSVESSVTNDESENDDLDLFAKNEVMRSIIAVADLHVSHWNHVVPEDDFQVYLELRHQRLFTQSISHAMLQSRVHGSQVIGLTLLLKGGNINTSLWL